MSLTARWGWLADSSCTEAAVQTHPLIRATAFVLFFPAFYEFVTKTRTKLKEIRTT